MRYRKQPWWWRVRALHDWAVEYGRWDAHVARLNSRCGLMGERALALSMQGWPPAWFTGDIERLQPNRWVLVVSLNPALAGAGHYHAAAPPSHAWRFWCEHNLEPGHWNSDSRFFPRLVELASRAFDGKVTPAEYPRFATERMLFLEFCPYASKDFRKMPWPRVQALADGDVGFAINRQIRSIAVTHGRPRLILVNGSAAVSDVNDQQRPDWQEHQVRDPSASARTMRLWTGVVRPWEQAIPILGFDFLGRVRHPSRFREREELTVLQERITSVLANRTDAGPA